MGWGEINSRDDMPSLKNSLTVLFSELLSEMPLLLAVAIVTYGGERIFQMANSRDYFTALNLKSVQ